MKVRDMTKLFRQQVRTITPDKTVQDAVHALVKHNIGALPVCDESGEVLLGIITERDILRFCARRPCEEMSRIEIGEVMTRDLVVGVLDDEVEHVMGIMTDRRIRHLPIVEDTKLIDIVSIGDVVKAQLDESSVENQFLRKYLAG